MNRFFFFLEGWGRYVFCEIFRKNHLKKNILVNGEKGDSTISIQQCRNITNGSCSNSSTVQDKFDCAERKGENFSEEGKSGVTLFSNIFSLERSRLCLEC